MWRCLSSKKYKVHSDLVTTIEVDEYAQLRNRITELEKQLSSISQGTPKRGRVDNKRCIVISYSTRQTTFKDRVAALLTSMQYEAWSGGEVQGGENWMNQWLRKVNDTNTIGIVFILSKAFILSPACMMELQFVMQNCQGKLGILPMMYEKFEMPQNLCFMLTTVNYITAVPESLTKCQCSLKCVCTGAALVREKKVSEVWLTGNTPGSFCGGLNTALRYDDEQSPTTDLLPGELHEKLLEDIRTDLRIAEDKFDGFVVVMGSTDFYNSKSKLICELIGQALAKSKSEFALVTGGYEGVDVVTAQAFSQARKASRRPEATYLVLPRTDPEITTRWKDKAPTKLTALGETVFDKRDFGKTFFYGNSNEERLAILGCFGTLILIEGGPKAQQTALMVEKAGHVVIPVRITGGAAGNKKVGRASPIKELLDAKCAAHFSEQVKKDLFEAQKCWELLDSCSVEDAGLVTDAVVRIVRTLSKHTNLFSQASQLPSQPGRVENRPDGLHELRGKEHLLEYMKYFDAVVLFNGYGSVSQYADLEECNRIVDIVVRNLDSLFGKNWLVMYGGEPYLNDVDTIAYPIRRLHKVHGKKVLAVQCTFYGKYILAPPDTETYAHLQDGAVYQYETKHYLNRFTKKKEIQFGGYDGARNLIGASKVWYSDELRNASLPTCHVLIGGGPIAADEADFCVNYGIPIFYARARRKIVDEDMMITCPAEAYGRMEFWANELGIPRDIWHPRTPENRCALEAVEMS